MQIEIRWGDANKLKKFYRKKDDEDNSFTVADSDRYDSFHWTPEFLDLIDLQKDSDRVYKEMTKSTTLQKKTSSTFFKLTDVTYQAPIRLKRCAQIFSFQRIIKYII